MSQSLADDGDGHVEFVHDAGPRMACDVGGEADFLAQHGRELLQIVVVGAEGCAIGPVGRLLVHGAEDGKEVRYAPGLGGIALDNLPHDGFQGDFYLLTGLATTIADDALTDILFLQVGQVHEGHAAGAVGEDEEVRRQGDLPIAASA